MLILLELLLLRSRLLTRWVPRGSYKITKINKFRGFQMEENLQLIKADYKYNFKVAKSRKAFFKDNFYRFFSVHKQGHKLSIRT